MNTFLEDEVNSEANRRTQPLSVDILVGDRPTPDSKNPLQDISFFTALLFGFTMLTRASSYLPISSAKYHLNTEHVAFTVAPLPGTNGPPTEVTADQLGDIPLSYPRGFRLFDSLQDGFYRSRASNTVRSSRD